MLNIFLTVVLTAGGAPGGAGGTGSPGIFTWVSIALVSVLAFFGLYNSKSASKLLQKFSGNSGTGQGTDPDRSSDIQAVYKSLEETINNYGYSYDSLNDLFYTTMDAWQRKMGYCRLYDEGAAVFGMIIDCEPVTFMYAGRKWLIEFWKGQYDMTTGCEIGVYTSEIKDIDIPGIFTGTFYKNSSDEDLLKMSFNLKKNGEVILSREDTHWWLTGFKLGEFSEPWELSMNASVTLKDGDMRDAFVNGLKNIGYSKDEIYISENTVSFEFDTPLTQQPLTRTKRTDEIIQRKNKLLCDSYQEVTGSYDTFQEKVYALKNNAPELYKEIFKMGKTAQVYKKNVIIQNYLS